jgi:chromosome partitioning protein
LRAAYLFLEQSMSEQRPVQTENSVVIVVGNEKGGSGKSTVAMQIAVALLKAGQSVATIDLDVRQRSFTRYIENRRAWAGIVGGNLEIPTHVCLGQQDASLGKAYEEAVCDTFVDTIEKLAKDHRYIVIDTPGYQTAMNQLVHSLADTLVTPLNDSLVDLDVLGLFDPETLEITGSGHYADMVQEARTQRNATGKAPTDWIVLRNRLSALSSRNKWRVGAMLEALSRRLGFRYVDGLTERVVFREFFQRGLTALDDVNEATLGTRPTMSHVTARQEVQRLVSAMRLSDLLSEEGSRDAA